MKLTVVLDYSFSFSDRRDDRYYDRGGYGGRNDDYDRGERRARLIVMAALKAIFHF